MIWTNLCQLRVALAALYVYRTCYQPRLEGPTRKVQRGSV